MITITQTAMLSASKRNTDLKYASNLQVQHHYLLAEILPVQPLTTEKTLTECSTLYLVFIIMGECKVDFES